MYTITAGCSQLKKLNYVEESILSTLKSHGRPNSGSHTFNPLKRASMRAISEYDDNAQDQADDGVGDRPARGALPVPVAAKNRSSQEIMSQTSTKRARLDASNCT